MASLARLPPGPGAGTRMPSGLGSGSRLSTGSEAANRGDELSMSLAEQIRAVDSKSPAELAKLAAEVEESMKNLDDLEPEIRQMLLRRQRVLASQESPVPPRTPELVETEKAPPPVRFCCCGCGAQLLCGSSQDEAMTQIFCRQTAEPERAPINAAAQRAYFEQLSKPRKKTRPSEDDRGGAGEGPTRLPDYEWLHRMAKPRDAPPPPPPEPVFRALPAPSFGRPSNSPVGMMGRPSFSMPDLRTSLGIDNAANAHGYGAARRAPRQVRTRSSLPSQLPPLEARDVGAGQSCTKFVELRCHALKASSSFLLPSYSSGMPGLGSDYSDELQCENAAEKKRRSAKQQRSYTEERLYTGPKAKPGSTADLQARLDALKRENQASRNGHLGEMLDRPRDKHSLRKIAEEVC